MRVFQRLEDFNEKVSFGFYRAFVGLAESRRMKWLMMATLAVATVMGFAGDVLAWTTPSSGSFLYDAYDIAVNKILKGPVGFIGGMGLVGYGGHAFLEGQKFRGVVGLLAGGSLVKLDAITESLGFYV